MAETPLEYNSLEGTTVKYIFFWQEHPYIKIVWQEPPTMQWFGSNSLQYIDLAGTLLQYSSFAGTPLL